ncbi:putative ribonuclease H-like domain-containing protein [Tanacetum coccineum]|uniref:Ribonuclease H-like domain-containing protein n=1 Tax=Tanacetum coccineum TaxID=301880 RepID=A0ABQ4YHS2_9ASTR
MKLTKLINSQISVNNKSGVGFDSQMNENELHDCHLNKSKVFESASDSSVNVIKEENNQVNDRFKKAEGYHAKTNVSETISSVPIIESTASKSSKDSLEQPKDVRPSAPIIEEWESDSDDDCVIRPSFEQNKSSYAKINFVKSDENTRKSVIEQRTYRQAKNLRKSQSPRVDKRNWNGIMTQKLGDGFEFNKKACFVCGSLNHLIKDCNFYENKIVGKSVLNNMGRVTAVATKSGLVPVNAAKQSSPRAAASISTARHVNTAALKQKVNAASPTKYSYFKSHSPLRRPFNQKSAAKANNFNKKVYTAKVNNVTTAGPEVVGNPQYALQDQEIFDSGCSRHMTRNKSYLTDYQDIDGGFVAFAGSPKGGKITRKGKIGTRKLDFEDVYFIKELKFNLFSVSQMCDMKNSVLLTKTECLVLSPDFKLLDESQVLLKVPRQNNMYSFDLKNVVSSGGEILLEAYLKCFLKMTILVLLVIRESNTKPLVRPSLFSWVFFFATKDETSRILKNFTTGIENQINHKVKIIRCDNGTEFKNNDINQFCGMKGIKREFSVARTPQQNGVVERKNMTLIEAARTMLADSLLPTTFYAEAVNTACYVQNRVLVTKPHNKTPYELLLSRPPSISFMRPFGCPVTILNTLDPLGKFDGKADEGILRSGPEWLFDIDSLTKSMNYEPVTAGNQTNGDAVIETNVNAGQSRQEKASDHEYILLPLMLSNSPLSSSSQSTDNKDADEVPRKGYDDLSERNGQENEEGASNKEDDQHVQDFRAELDNLLVQQKEDYANNTNRVSIVNPSVCAAGQGFDNADDQERIDSSTQDVNIAGLSINTASENINTGSSNINTASPIPNDPSMQSLEAIGLFYEAYDDREEVGAEADLNNSVWTLVDLPKGKRAIRTKWVYRNKKDEREIVVRNKARLVAQEKVLYGLHQAPRAWYEILSTYLLENGYKRGTIDKTLFIKKDRGDIMLVHVYVNDIIFGSTKKSLCVEFEQMMHKRFQMSSMGELTFFLGLQVQQKEDGIFISQDKYVADILKKFDFTTVKAASTPIETNKALNKDEEAKDVDVHLYRSMIGSLMYLTASRPDIMFVVCACARFQVTPKTSHLHAVKRIFRYLKGQPKLGLWYPRDSPFDLEAFSNSDYAGASLDRKSTTGGCQFLGKRLISWQCKKQTIVANSTTEAEYVAAANCCGQVLWIQNQMLDYGFNFMNTKIHIDNESTICIVKNLVFHSKTKHIEIRHHFIRDSYEKKLIQVIKIHTDHNVADLLTKAFDVSRKAKRTTKISQSSGPIHLVADETVYKEWEDRMERVATTASSLEAEQDSVLFEQTAAVNTLDSREVQITATIDGKVKLVSKASIRRHLKLEDSDGITTLPNIEIFEQLTLMGTYIAPTLTQKLFSNIRRASKGYTRVDIPLFPTMLIQGPIMQGEGSTVLVESHHTPSGPLTTSQPPLSSSSRIPTRQETEVPQLSSPTYSNVADEAAFTSVDVVHRGAATTVSSIDAGQGSGNIPKSPTMPHDSPLPGGHTPGSDEDSMTLHELTVKKLEQIVKISQARRRAKIVVSDDEESSEDPSKQGRMIEDIDQDAGISLVTPTKVSSQEDQSKDQLGVLSAAKVLADTAKKNVNTYTRRRRVVSTGSEGVSTASRIFSTAKESVSTAGTSMPVSTAGMVQQVNIIIPSSSKTTETTKDKGKAIMQESEQPKKIKKRVQIQMSLDEELAQKLHEEEQARLNAEQEAKFNAEQEELLATNEDLAQKLLEEEWENLSIEERARLLAELIDKRKKLQAVQRYKAIKNKPQTKLYEVKEMFDNVYKQVTSFVPMDSVMEKKEQKEQKFNRDDLDKLWSLVKERFNSTDHMDDKERTLWVELKRLFEPDTDDILWKLQRYMHDHVKDVILKHVVFTMYL